MGTIGVSGQNFVPISSVGSDAKSVPEEKNPELRFGTYIFLMGLSNYHVSVSSEGVFGQAYRAVLVQAESPKPSRVSTYEGPKGPSNILQTPCFT